MGMEHCLPVLSDICILNPLTDSAFNFAWYMLNLGAWGSVEVKALRY